MTITLREIFFFGIAALLGMLALQAKPTMSQTAPTFWVTWATDAYTAPLYEGKSLPTNGSAVNVAFELIENGKVVSLSSQEIKWFLGSTLVKKAHGVKEYTFRSEAVSGANQLRIELPGFRGGATLAKSLAIPAVSPEVVLDAPYIKNAITGSELTLEALPYYFNAQRLRDILFNWKINNEAPSGTVQAPNKLTITIPDGALPGSKIFTEVQAINAKNQNERAEAKALFTTK